MAKQDSEKYLVEVNSLLVNLKIALQEFINEPNTRKNQEVLAELFHQIIEVSGIYGINPVKELCSKMLELLKSVHLSEKEVVEALCTHIAESEPVLQQLVEDPIMKQKDLKLRYTEIIKKTDELLTELEGSESDSNQATKKFQEVFIEEAFDLINQLEEKMLQLESDPQDAGMIDQVFRIMHTLKGNSNMFGFQYLGAITHELENIYDDIRSEKLKLSRDILEVTLECVDHFRNLIEDAELTDGKTRKRHEQILGEIKELRPGDSSVAHIADARKVSLQDRQYHTFYLFFKPGKDIFSDGTNPLYFINDLHELGQCLPVPVIKKDAQNSKYNPEECRTLWHIALATDSTEEEVREHFMFLREESQPVIRILSELNLLSAQDFEVFFTSQTKDKLEVVELDLTRFHAEDNPDRKRFADRTGRASNEGISSVRVSSQKIDQMMNLISELVIKQAELTLLAAGHENQKLLEVAESIENISRDLRDNAFSISLIPLEKSVLRFQRLVRDVSRRFDKKVNFLVEGKETELDKTIIEKIVDPIMHILRNNIDHGIELPAERIQKGKPETGTIKLKAYPSGAHVIIEISDDGAGINLEKVRSTAIEKGMISATDSINREELLNLIVSPGFTTAENISEVSGRGVGMDVVNQKIAEVRGELEMHTEKDKGTTITIKLPLTISIIDSLLLRCAGKYYLVPLAVVERCAGIKSSVILEAGNKYIVLNKEYIPFIDLRVEFDIKEERPETQQVLIVKYRDIQVGFIIDEVIGNYQAVLKSLGAAYRKQEMISGASILGSGEIALVLDVSRIIQEFSAQKEIKANAMA
jgi:two-component system, chemotaxis family, sensor kinase CheA